MNSCGEEAVHCTKAFTVSVITGRPLEAWWVGNEGVRLDSWRKQVAETVGGLVEVHVGEFFLHCISHVLLVSYSTPGLHENDCRPFLQKHCTLWPSVCLACERWVTLCCAALQEVKGGNSYLTCTAERLQLTERCHFRRERSTPDCKHKNVSQGQDVQSHTCPAGFFRATSYIWCIFIQLTQCRWLNYSEHCSVTLTIYPCWKCR